MRHYYFVLILVLSSCLTLTSCKKETITPTQLQVTVRDKNNDLVSGASVFLYGTETDWANGTNLLYSAYTSTKGEAFFDLEDKKYYIVVTYNCLANKMASSSDYTIIVSKNSLSKKEIKVIGGGLIYFQNNSVYTIRFDVYNNNVLLRSAQLAPLVRTPAFWFQDGYYDITVRILPNGAPYSLGHNYLNCGGSLIFYYP